MDIHTIENFVNVMELQALMHVSKAKKKAEKHYNVGRELTNIIGKIFYNKNIVLDKNVITPDKENPVLNIFLASDYGMCGKINLDVKQAIKDNLDSYKIIIGKKIRYTDDKVLLKINHDDFDEKFSEIEKIMVDAIVENKYSEINIFYNHYNNVSNISFQKVRLFPVEFDSSSNTNEDFVIETDVEILLKHLVSYYICYELKLCEIMGWASENVLRNQQTKVSVDKLEKIKQKTKLIEQKEKRKKAISKNIDNYKNFSNLNL